MVLFDEFTRMKTFSGSNYPVRGSMNIVIGLSVTDMKCVRLFGKYQFSWNKLESTENDDFRKTVLNRCQ